MYKTLKFRIYPNEQQKIFLSKSFGCTRFVYNYYLASAIKDGYKNANAYIQDYTHNLKYKYLFLQEIDSILIRKTIFHLDDAYQKFFKNKYGYPKFKSKNSKNYYKCRNKLANLYSRLKNARNYYLHKITKNIVDNYDIITCEKLKTKDMLMNKRLSKKISDASFYEIIRQLQYKAKYKGKFFYQVDSYYKSSQTCSICDHIDSKYKNLNERTYRCCNCNNILDRDLNASINIMFEGLKLYMKDRLTC